MRDIDRREAAINASLVVLSFLLVLGTLEVALVLNVIDGSGNDRSGPKYQFCDQPGVHQFHPVYGWTAVPNSTYYRKESRYQNWSMYRTNREGFRDTLDTGKGNIVVVGDSFTQGNLADDKATFPYLLERWTPNTSIRTYANGGYSTGQELLVYRNVSDSIDHDLVILVYYFGNDMTDNADARPRRPRFAVRNGTLIQEHTPVNRSARDGKETVGEKLDETLRDHTESYGFLRPRLHSLLSETGLVESGPEPPQGETYDRQLVVARHLLTEFANEARANDADLLVVTIPERGEVNPDNPARFDPDDAERFWSGQRRMIRDVAKEHQEAEALHLRQDLVAANASGERVYGRINPHLNERGYRVVARTLYDRLASRGHITRGSPDFSADYAENRTPC